MLEMKPRNAGTKQGRRLGLKSITRKNHSSLPNCYPDVGQDVCTYIHSLVPSRSII
jgi:hypothetical protein